MLKPTAAVLSATVALAAFSYWQNNGLQSTELTVESEKLPHVFNGFRIVQISDLHDQCFGAAQNRLVRAVVSAQPDLLVITGDLCDGRPDIAMALIRSVKGLAPICFVPGNHEARSRMYSRLRRELSQAGVLLLDDRKLVLHRGKESLCVYGVKDPAFYRKRTLKRDTGECVARFAEKLGELAHGISPSHYHILLSHRPELLGYYAQEGFDLAFCGHAHGGQFRFPGVPGLYAPEQGLFPRFTAGLYRAGGCTMVVSRGLGPSSFPQRLGNRPELVCVTLRRNG